jgi:hypothetical protein
MVVVFPLQWLKADFPPLRSCFSHFMRHAKLTCWFLLGIGAGTVNAGPPFVTDDPEPAELHIWEVNYAVNGTHADGVSNAFLPGTDINYGAAPGVQLHAQLQMAYNQSTGSTHYGLGDTELGIKYRLTNETEDASEWMVSVYPALEIPTGSPSKRLGAGSSSIFLPVWVQTTRGNWTLFGGGGYWLNHGAGSRDAWSAGWAALYQVEEGLQLGGEVFGKNADTANGRGSSGFNLGGVYGLEKDVNLLFSAGRGLSNVANTNQASLYLGLQVIY